MGTFIAQKIFLNQSDESEEAAKELVTKAEEAKAKTEADDGAKRAEEKATKSAAVKLAGTKQKIKKQAATDKQKTEAAPSKAKEDAPLKRRTVSFHEMLNSPARAARASSS